MSFIIYTTPSSLCIITGRNEVVAKVIFLHLSVILFTGGEHVWGRPPRSRSPLGQTPLGQTPPWVRHPPGQIPPQVRHTPRGADSGIQSTSGRYASYWNAFLLRILFTLPNHDTVQWRIYIVKFWTRAPPLGVQILSISCSFWGNLAKSYVGAPPGELAPPPRGNPRSATADIN